MKQCRFVRQIVMLLALPLIPAVAAGLWHPKAPMWTAAPLGEDEVTIEQALAWGPTVLWLDARPRKDFEASHMPGALLLNEDHWHDLLPGVLDAWQPEMKIVVYCDSKTCDTSREVANRLRSEVQLPDVFILHGGWQAWLANRKP